MIYEVEQEEIKNYGDNSTAKDEVVMILIRNPCLHNNRYRIVACNGVAAVFIGEDGILNMSKHVDPMVYPLMFPFGESAWSPYMKS